MIGAPGDPAMSLETGGPIDGPLFFYPDDIESDPCFEAFEYGRETYRLGVIGIIDDARQRKLSPTEISYLVRLTVDSAMPLETQSDSDPYFEAFVNGRETYKKGLIKSINDAREQGLSPLEIGYLLENEVKGIKA